MKKATNQMAKAVVAVAEKVARNSVGRSIPLCMYEPRVPKSLKQKNVKVIK